MGHTENKMEWVLARDWTAVALLTAVSVLVRLPILKYFNLVSFDGTFYVNQARALWSVVSSGAPMPGQFPIGYPFFVSLLLPFFSDDVVAAQTVSFLGGLGSVIVLYHLAKAYLPRHLALSCAGFLALTPLFIRLSLLTMSESTYTCWMLVALLLYARRRDFPTGLAAGVAAITRPEMLALTGLFALGRARAPRRAATLLAGFLIVYAVNVGVMYRATGKVLVLQKKENFGLRAQSWIERERTAGEQEVESRDITPAAVAGAYARALPADVWTLARHTVLLLLLLAIYGAVCRPTFVLFAMVPFLAIPLFGPRSFERFFVPYLPIVMLYAFVGMDRLRGAALRRAALAVMCAALVAGAVWNRGRLTQVVDDGFIGYKEAGLELRERVRPGDMLADRNPLTAFYAGARFVEIPLDDYEATMDYLVVRDVRFISLFHRLVEQVRPVFAPLVTDRAAILGELRYQQVQRHPSGLFIYERTSHSGALAWRRLTPPGTGQVESPTWSSDGSRVAFVVRDAQAGAIYSVPADGSAPPRILVDLPGQDEHPAWSRDGKRLAFASRQSGNWEIYVLDVAGNDVRQVTGDAAANGAPAWLGGDAGLVFVSSRGGTADLWAVDLDGGEAVRVTTTGGHNFPAVSPSGRNVASIVHQRGLAVTDLETGVTVLADGPTDVQYRPAWSPDGRFIAVTARDWGSVDVYLVTADGAANLLLTKNAAAGDRTWFDGHPAWGPGRDRIALVSNKDDSQALYIVEGVDAYCERLVHPPHVETYDPKRRTRQ